MLLYATKYSIEVYVKGIMRHHAQTLLANRNRLIPFALQKLNIAPALHLFLRSATKIAWLLTDLANVLICIFKQHMGDGRSCWFDRAQAAGDLAWKASTGSRLPRRRNVGRGAIP
ncbi:hypothetical protein [Pararhizobium gei]|uniref:hypothetical protein n=1 Tax=Pararhizobium gei TaxID=1395951 RepID=UPI0023DA527A|nr:hypothetical protein [Rhizobium gei]